MIDQFSTLVGLLLAISLATERLVTIFKTIWPVTLGEEKLDSNGLVNKERDRWRKLMVQVISFGVSWITASFLTDKNTFDFFGHIDVGIGEGKLQVSVVVVALLSMGGSAFWNNLLGYTKAIKEIKVQQKEIGELSNPQNESDRISSRTTNDKLISIALTKLQTKGQPTLDSIKTN